MSELGGIALALDDRAQLCCHIGDFRRVVGRDIRDAEAAAEIELGQLDAVFVTYLAQQRDDAVR